MKSLIVIPTYNEIENIKLLIEAILGQVPALVEVLVVDDASPDGTGELVDALALECPCVHVLHRAKKKGLGTAYVEGFYWGLERDFDRFIEMDADFSHSPSYLIQMLHLLDIYDGVIGSRYVLGGGTLNWGFSRKLLSRFGSLYSQFILGVPIKDFTGGFNGWRSSTLEDLGLSTLCSDGYSFQIELKYRAFLKKNRMIEFPILFEDRKVGTSKMHVRIIFEALVKVWSFRWHLDF